MQAGHTWESDFFGWVSILICSPLIIILETLIILTKKIVSRRENYTTEQKGKVFAFLFLFIQLVLIFLLLDYGA